MPSREPPTIRIDPLVVGGLGVRLHGSGLLPALSGMVANAWDADAARVDIALPEGDITEESAIVVSDCGSGMSHGDMSAKYLRTGRNRRDEDGGDRTPGGRRVMGRKGIGKLSAFGVARNVEVSTAMDGRRNTIAMNIYIIHEGLWTKADP